MKTTRKLSIAAAFALAACFSASSAFAHDEHGHCSGPDVCKGDAACEKQGFEELTKEECAKIPGAKFVESDHKGEDHKHGDHKH